MTQHNSMTIRKPRADERPLWDLIEAAIISYGLLVAHDLKLFRFLADQPRTLQEVCDALKIASRSADALLTLCVSAGLLQVEDGRYLLTSLAEDYLLEGSSTYFGGFLDLAIAIDSSGGLSVGALKKAVLTNSPQIFGGGDLFKSLEEQVALARDFTRGMHGHSMGAALAWPEVLDLSAYRLLLDIGGGSGAQVAKAFDGRPSSLVAENVRVQFRQRDGFELAINVERPTLVFLDPPFADREREWQLLAGTCMHLNAQHIAFLAWYPYSWHTFPNWIVEKTECETWEVFWAECGERPSQNLKGCGMLMSPEVSAALREAESTLAAVPTCLGWTLRARKPAA